MCERKRRPAGSVQTVQVSGGVVDRRGAFDGFARSTGERVRRALVATYGVEIGTEAASDAMAVAWERWDQVAVMDNPAGWLFRVGQSKARPHLRWTRRRGAFPAADRSVLGTDGAVVDLLRALRHVSQSQRVAVVLVKCHGHTYAEAAEVMGVTEAAVTNHVHRGLARLKAYLEGE